MSLSLFIARRIYREHKGSRRVSRPAVLIAMAGIAIGLAVMIVSVAVVVGFKSEVRDKVAGFGSHIQVMNLDAVQSYETYPVVASDSMMQALRAYPEVCHVQRYSTKPGMIKTDDAFQGMVLKGVGPEFDTRFMEEYLLEGEVPAFSDSVPSNQVLIAKPLADKLKVKLGDKIYTYYVQENIRARRLTVAGIYQTNFSEYDNLFLLTDLALVNRLNGWEDGQVSGMELQVRDYERLDEVTYQIALDTDRKTDAYGGVYFVQNIEELNPQVFAWLDLLDLNVWVILILMIGIAGFTMISGLLIIIIERTNMIGLLKALGADNLTIRKVFLWLSVFLIGRGMFWGNIIGIGFCALQSQCRLFKLDPTTYYVDAVPVSFSWGLFVLLNVGTLLAAVLMLVGPSCWIAKIHPARSMRYE